MRFSVLVPVYNVKGYLAACLDSIVMQHIDDMELVVVNDGSTDGSQDICRLYQKRYPQLIRLVEQSNRGLLLARRAGIDVARGDYLVFVDGDDVLRADALHIIDERLRMTDADVLMFQASRSPQFNVPYFDYTVLYDAMNSQGVIPACLVRKLLATSHNANSMWGKAIRRTCIDQGTDYSCYEGLQYGEDLLQMASVFDKASIFAVARDILYFYRENGTSISHHVRASRLDDIQNARTCLADYVRRWDAGLLPYVYANDCVEVFSYCLMCANRLSESEAHRKIGHATALPFFQNACVRACLDAVPLWKRMGIGALRAGHIALFTIGYRFVFNMLRLIKPDKAMRYI